MCISETKKRKDIYAILSSNVQCILMIVLVSFKDIERLNIGWYYAVHSTQLFNIFLFGQDNQPVTYSIAHPEPKQIDQAFGRAL